MKRTLIALVVLIVLGIVGYYIAGIDSKDKAKAGLSTCEKCGGGRGHELKEIERAKNLKQWRAENKLRELRRLWPEVVIDPKFEYVGENIKERAMADGLSAWASCMAGNLPPKNFGYAMIKVGKIVGVSPTPDNLMEVSKHYERKEQ